MKKVLIDKDKCIGCFSCEDVSGGIIKVKDGLGTVNPKADLNDSKVQEKIRLAVESCPMQAIKVIK